MPKGKRQDEIQKAWAKKRLAQKPVAGAKPRVSESKRAGVGARQEQPDSDGSKDTVRILRTPAKDKPVDRSGVSVPNQKEADQQIDPWSNRKSGVFYGDLNQPEPTRWQKFKSTLSLARWGLKTYRSKKQMAEEENGGFIEGFPQYDPVKNHKRGVEGASAAGGGVVAGGAGLGLVLSILVWLRSIGVELPWPDSGDIGFATIVGAVLTPIGAYITGRINNKAKYNADAAKVDEQ